MRIQGLPKAVKNIYKAYAGSKVQTKAWNRHFKKVSDDTLVAVIKKILQAPENYNSTAWKFAGVALNELVIRPWGKKHEEKLYDMRDALIAISKLCFSAQSYSLETAGIHATTLNSRAKKNKIIHPYAYSKTALKVIQAWHDSRTTKSLEAYIASSVTKKDKRALQRRKVTYLSPKELDAYQVTFTEDLLKIGGQTPENGWYIFVLGGKKTTLLAGVKRKGLFHHTSFLGGEPLTCTGEFRIKDGKISRILLRSGHYRPTEEHGEFFRLYLEREENLGPTYTSRLEIEPYQN